MTISPPKEGKVGTPPLKSTPYKGVEQRKHIDRPPHNFLPDIFDLLSPETTLLQKQGLGRAQDYKK